MLVTQGEMHRYSAPSYGNGFRNVPVGVAPLRDRVGARADSASFSSNLALNSRKLSRLSPHKLKCEKEPLNCRLGPPDFNPQTANCPEETLSKECISFGYKETVEGIEESQEIKLTQIGNLSKSDILNCKEAIKQRSRIINKSRVQKRKASQVYGVPLSGHLLAKAGVFPEQRQFNDSRRKWIEGLLQQNKRLQSLGAIVPHGYRRKGLIDVIIRHNVPLLRATWFIKVSYLNQVRPKTARVSSGTPDNIQSARTELWTNDLIEYLHNFMDEFLAKDGFFSPEHSRDKASQTLLSGLSHERNDLLSVVPNSGKSSLQFKRDYLLHLLRWNYAEGILFPSLILQWALAQLQEKESLAVLEFLLPIIVDLVESVALSQTYVRIFVDIAIRFLHSLYPNGMNLMTNATKPHLASSLVELLRFLLLSAPDAFVGLDCFPLPISVVPDIMSCKVPLTKIHVSEGKVNHESQDSYHGYLSFGHVASSLRMRASSLAMIANVNFQGHGVAKVVYALDNAVIHGNSRDAYTFLFEELPNVAFDDSWISEVSPCLRSSLKWVRIINPSVIHAVFFLCEWATCDFRDICNLMPQDVKFTGRKDCCQVYVAVLLLKYWMDDMHTSDGIHGNILDDDNRASDIFESPCPLHDIIVCWLDQHEFGKSEGFRRIQILILEFIRHGIFYPQVYVRQLIVSGTMDRAGTRLDIKRRRNHSRILKQLPGACLFDALEESKIAETEPLRETVHIYTNERRLVLRGLCNFPTVHMNNGQYDSLNSNKKELKHNFAVSRDGSSSSMLNHKDYNVNFSCHSSEKVKSRSQVGRIKSAICTLLHLPHSCYSIIEIEPGAIQVNSKRKPDNDECTRAKRQRTSSERALHIPRFSSNKTDDNDTWWVKKEADSDDNDTFVDSSNSEQPLKSVTHFSIRSKCYQKTQSLGQLQDLRIESSQSTSTSHVCDNKITCSDDNSQVDGEVPKLLDGLSEMNLNDIGKALKTLRWLEKRSIVIWLVKSIRLLIEGNKHSTSNFMNHDAPVSQPTHEKGVVRWKIGEDELSSILYLLDISSDLYSLIKFLLWLLPKIVKEGTSTVVSRNKENHMCNIKESFMLSALQRYENVIVATDLLPEFLSFAMHRAVTSVTSNDFAFDSLLFVYAKNILKKYRTEISVVNWLKGFKASCHPRFLEELKVVISLDGDIGFGAVSVIKGLDDDCIQKILSGKTSKASQLMRYMVNEKLEGQFYSKVRTLFSSTANIRSSTLGKWDDGCQIAQQIVLMLLDFLRLSSGTSQEVNPSLVVLAVSVIVSNVGLAIVELPDFTSNAHCQSFPSSAASLSCIQGVVNIHLACLCLLKEALGECWGHVFDVVLATEAPSHISAVFASRKVPRGQFQLSPVVHGMSPNMSNDLLIVKKFSERASEISAAMSSLIVGAIVHGVSSLERMIKAVKLNEALDILQFIRNSMPNLNGRSCLAANFKSDNSIEVSVHWFRLLVGNCSTIFNGLIVDVLGEARSLALTRMQQKIPLNLVFPLAYSIFAIVIWRPYIVNSDFATCEDIHLHNSFSIAIGDAVKHHPFRDLCLQDSRALYDLISSDKSECEFGAILEQQHIPDKRFKTFLPRRGRLFLNAIVDCSMPSFSEMKGENEAKLLDQLVHVMDTLQPAKFHWQWLQLRLLLNEQALKEKIETDNMSIVEALHSLSTTAENGALSDNEDAFTDIVLTRLLVRPDATPLYSELFHLLGKSLEVKLLLHAKWFLGGNDVLLGRKSVRQRLLNIAQLRGLTTKSQFCKPWGWASSNSDGACENTTDNSKLETNSLEEGEVVEDEPTMQPFGSVGLNNSQQYATDKAFLELIFPFIDRSSDEARTTFAMDLIKQLNTIYQCINTFTCGNGKQNTGVLPSGGNDGSGNKVTTRKGICGGSLGIVRKSTTVSTDSTPSSAAALKASIWLRLHFLLRLFPTIYQVRESSSRKLRNALAFSLLHLLGTQLIYEDAGVSFTPVHTSFWRNESDISGEESVISTSLDISGESLFDIMLAVLHASLSRCRPSWLKPSRSTTSSKLNIKSSLDFSVHDHETVESLQVDLDRMQNLPASIRRRLQSAMPMLPPNPRVFVSCQPPSMLTTGFNRVSPNSPHKKPGANASVKTKSSLALQDNNGMEIDPWMLLEDGAVSGGSTSSNSNDQSNLKASFWLKGAVRVRRTDLRYIGAVNDGS